MATCFFIKTQDDKTIKFRFYHEAAPVTTSAFLKILPFSLTLFHARVSGQEIWADKAHKLDIIQENASVFVEPGEIVMGPLKPERAKTAGCIGIYYGDGKGLDCCNIFGKVLDENLFLLKDLGNAIWQKGAQELIFDILK